MSIDFFLNELNNVAIAILVVVGIYFELVYIRRNPNTPQSRLKLLAIIGLLYAGGLQVLHFLGYDPPKLPNDWFEWGVFLLVAVIVAKAISESGRGSHGN